MNAGQAQPRRPSAREALADALRQLRPRVTLDLGCGDGSAIAGLPDVMSGGLLIGVDRDYVVLPK